MKVGFVGLGSMGEPMARNLINAGHELTVYNRTRSRAEPFEARGAKVASTPGEAAASAEVVVTMLADDHALAEVMWGQGNMLERLVPGGTHVSMSTISADLSAKLEEVHRQAGQNYVAAPVLGRPEAAANAKLFILAAGQRKNLERVQPLLDAMGQNTFVLGERPAQANVAKLVANFLIASVIETVAEALALVRKSGMDAQQYLDILTNTLFSAPIYKTYGRLVAQGGSETVGFKMPLALKDVRLVLNAAEKAAVPMPVASVIRDHVISAIARGLGDADWSAFSRVVAENAGIRIP